MRILYLIITFFLFSCQEKVTDNDYIEITNGFDMNPKKPRIGIVLNSKDSLYFCKEIIKGGKGTGEYEYFKLNDTINFDKFKKQVLRAFNKINALSGIPDSQPQQLKYQLESNNYKQIFYMHELSPEQQRIIRNILLSKENKKLSKISYYKFSSDLLKEKLPLPPH